MSLRRTLQGAGLFSLMGLGISLYLTWVYTRDGVPVCLGSGGCSTVQHSSYAWFGPVPMPALGAVVYIVLIGLAVAALRRPDQQETLLLGMFGIGLAGVLFSVYLTYVEIWVIEAICLWCVASAVVMLLVFGLAVLAWREYGRDA